MKLADKGSDTRRGLTVIARLQPSVTEQLGNMLEALSAIEPISITIRLQTFI